MLISSPVLSIIAAVVVYTIIYRTTVEEKDAFVGYDQSSLMYTALAGTFVYIGLNYFTTTTNSDSPVGTETSNNTRIINGENVMVAPYSST